MEVKTEKGMVKVVVLRKTMWWDDSLFLDDILVSLQNLKQKAASEGISNVVVSISDIGDGHVEICAEGCRHETSIERERRLAQEKKRREKRAEEKKSQLQKDIEKYSELKRRLQKKGILELEVEDATHFARMDKMAELNRKRKKLLEDNGRG